VQVAVEREVEIPGVDLEPLAVAPEQPQGRDGSHGHVGRAAASLQAILDLARPEWRDQDLARDEDEDDDAGGDHPPTGSRHR
jgi:hypothetical protein